MLVTCPGAKAAPAPPETPLGARDAEQLPSPGKLAEPMHAHWFDGSSPASSDQAKMAAHQVDSGLRRHRRDAARASGNEDPGIPVLPLTNPLSWEPAPEQGS